MSVDIPMTIEEQYAALRVAPQKMREIAHLMAHGMSTVDIAAHMNMKPDDIDRIPMKYPDEWWEAMSAATRAACFRTVLTIMAHAQVIATSTTEPKGLAALMQAIGRWLKLPFLFGRDTKGRHQGTRSGGVPTSEPRASAPVPVPKPASPTMQAPTLETHIVCEPSAPKLGTPTPSKSAPKSIPYSELSDAEIRRCAALHHADPANDFANLEEQEPALHAKCATLGRVPSKPTPPPAPVRTALQRVTHCFRLVGIRCATWFRFTHPPHH